MRRDGSYQSSANPGLYAATGGNGWAQTKAKQAEKLILLCSAEHCDYLTSLPRGLFEDGSDRLGWATTLFWFGFVTPRPTDADEGERERQ